MGVRASGKKMMRLLTGHFHFPVCLGEERTVIKAVRSLVIKTNKQNNPKTPATFCAEMFINPFCNFFSSPAAPLTFLSDMVPIIPQV